MKGFKGVIPLPFNTIIKKDENSSEVNLKKWLNDSKERLWDIKKAIEEYLEKDRLKLHPKKCWVFPVSTGTDLLGFKVFSTHRLLRKDNSMRFINKLRKMSRLYREGVLDWRDIKPSVQAWLGHASHADTYWLKKSVFERITFSRG